MVHLMHLQCLRFKSVAVAQLGVSEKKKCAGLFMPYQRVLMEATAVLWRPHWGLETQKNFKFTAMQLREWDSSS